jgi:MYXO-CTERM domain-containing protein
MRIRAFALAFVSALLLSFSALGSSQAKPADRLLSPIVSSQRTITNPVHPLATRQNDLGRVNANQVFHRLVLLLQRSPDQEASLRQLLKDQQDKTSPQYHQWLTPAQFGQRFGPSDNDLATITGWLRARGFSVEAPSNGRQFLVFTGTSSQLETAFQTEMHRYSVHQKTYFANAKPASIPAALAPSVRGMASLTSFAQMQPQYHLAANPNMDIGGAPLTGPADLSAVYDASPLQISGIQGQGQSIALIEESNINPTDLTEFRSITGLPAATLNVIVNGPDPGPLYNGEETEAIADVEYAGAFTPDATLNVVVTASTELNQGIDLSTIYAVDFLVSPITSLSYGGCEALDNTYLPGTEELYQYAYEQGAAEGISHFVSSGDYGGDSCGYLGIGAGYGVNAIGSSPWNVSVGGTEFIMPDPNVYFPAPSFTATGYIPESTWNDYENPEDGRSLAGGGGASVFYNSLTNPSLGIGKPAWQTGPGVPADNARDVPDVSLVAGDNLAYMVCQADAFGGNCAQGQALGLIGTSLASPSWASIQALINQKNNLIDGAGNPNPVYYQLAGQQNSPFHDITVGDTKVPDGYCSFDYCAGANLVGYVASPGYDLTTGLGSVDVNQLASNWLPPTGSGVPTVTLSTGGVTSITHGDALTVTVSVSSGGSTVPTGNVVLLAGTQAIDQITLDGTGNATLQIGAASGIELPGGSYNLIAQYAGDAHFAVAKSNSIPLTVNPEATITQASSSSAVAVPYGTIITISAAAYGVNSSSGYPVPGAYSFSEGATTLGSATLAQTGERFSLWAKGTTANLQLSGTTLLGAGTHLIVVSSPPASASFEPSVSGPVEVVVNKSAVLVSLIPNHTNPTVNSTVNLVVTVQNLLVNNNYVSLNEVPVTGNVDFYDTSTNPATKLGTAALSAGGTTSLPVTFSAAGQHALVAQYDGDANNLPNTSGAVDISVGSKSPTSITVSSGINFTYAPTPINLQAVVTGDSAGALPTGTVTFTDATANNGAGSTVGSATLGSSGSATFSATSLSPGTHSITASYPGDANFAGSTSVAYQVSIISLNLTSSPASATVSAGQNVQSIAVKIATNSIFTNYYFSSVNLACSGLPTGASCVFGTTAVNPTYNSTTGVLSGSTTLAIYSTGPTLQKAAVAPPHKPWHATAPLALAGLVALVFRRRRVLASLAGLIMLVFFLGLSGCTSGSGGQYNITSPGTPAGSYPVTVTGTMIDGPFGTFTTTATFNLTVTAVGQ